MRKHLSVFGLFARSSIYKILAILFFLCCAQIGLFAYKFAGESATEYVARLEYYINASDISVSLGIAFVLITLVLCLIGTEFKTKVGYTLRRLSVSERAVFYHQAAFNSLMYILLWAVQLMLVYGFSLYYKATVPPEFSNNQSIFLAFYRNEFLHSLLPLSETMLWIRNFLFITALGFASAELPYLHRRKRYSAFIFPIVIYMLFFFICGIGVVENIIFSILLCIIIIVKALYTLYHKEDSYDK